jgi:hypothetical protein
MPPTTRRTLWGAIFVLVVLCALLATQSQAILDSLNSRWTCKPGPWGEVECVHISVEMPEAFVALEQVKGKHAHWFFGGKTQADALQFLQGVGLSDAELAALMTGAKWEQDITGVWLSPPDQAVLAMNNDARQAIYSHLATFPENEPQYSPFAYRAELLPDLLKRSHLPDETLNAFKKLLYLEGTLLLFSDADIFVNQLADDQQKTRFLKTISRAPTLLMKVHVDANSDIDSLTEYWGFGGRKKDVRSLLESMAAVPGGCKIDLAHLLPTFLRQRIYTYPNPALVNTNEHCHWTSMNFLNESPDPRFGDNAYVQQVVGSEFLPITDAPRLGDVIFFMDYRGDVVHSATFIADSIVFTKNGGAANRPWIYMELSDLLACYITPDAPLQTMICRRKTI